MQSVILRLAIPMLKETIISDLKLSLKEGNDVRTGTLRLLLSAIQNKEIEKRSSGSDSLSDDEILGLVLREVKKRKEAIQFYEKGGRSELASKELSEIKELEKYLPEPLSDTEVLKIIEETIQTVKPSNSKDIGKVMSLVVNQTKGRADSKMISELVKTKLKHLS